MNVTLDKTHSIFRALPQGVKRGEGRLPCTHEPIDYDDFLHNFTNNILAIHVVFTLILACPTNASSTFNMCVHVNRNKLAMNIIMCVPGGSSRQGCCSRGLLDSTAGGHFLFLVKKCFIVLNLPKL